MRRPRTQSWLAHVRRLAGEPSRPCVPRGLGSSGRPDAISRISGLLSRPAGNRISVVHCLILGSGVQYAEY